MTDSNKIIRKKTKEVLVGKVKIGGNSPIVVQSMTDTDTVNISATVSQIILILSVPIIAIIYSPEAFGYAAYFIAFGSILSALSTGKYDFAIFSPKDKVKSIQFLFGSIIINVLFTLILTINTKQL